MDLILRDSIVYSPSFWLQWAEAVTFEGGALN